MTVVTDSWHRKELDTSNLSVSVAPSPPVLALVAALVVALVEPPFLAVPVPALVEPPFLAVPALVEPPFLAFAPVPAALVVQTQGFAVAPFLVLALAPGFGGSFSGATFFGRASA